MAAGPEVHNPAELLSSARMAELLEELRACYDLVVLDSSPLLAVTDPSVLGSLVDGIALVVRAGRLRHREAEAVRDLIATLGHPVLGMMVNGIGREYGGYGYGYGYGAYGSPYGGQNGTPLTPLLEAAPRSSSANGNGNGNGHADPFDAALPRS